MTLPRRLLLVVAICLLPLAALEAANAWALRQAEADRSRDQARRLLALVAAEQLRVAEGVRHVLSTLRQTRAVREADDAACQELMRRLRGEYPAYLDAYALDAAGRVRCSTDARAAGLALADRAHVRAALAGVPFFAGPSILSRVDGRRVLPYAMPVAAGDGKAAGAVAATLDAGWLETFLAERPLPAGAALTVADRDGTALVRAPFVQGVVGRPLPPAYLALLGEAGEGVREMTGLDGVPRLLAYAPPGSGADGLLIAVGIDKAVAQAPVDEALARSLGLLALSVLATMGAAAALGRRYLQRPVAELAQAARRWRAGELDARAAVGAGDLAPLAAEFNAMAAALAARGRELADSEARHRAIVETAVDAMVVIDEAGTIRSVNPAAERTFGHPAAALLGRNVSLLMPGHHRDRHDGYVEAYRRTGERRIIGIGRGVEGMRADGSTFPLDLSIAEWRDAAGTRFFTGIMRDTTRRHAAEARLRLLADLAGGLLAATDPDAALRGMVAEAGPSLGLDVVLSYVADPTARTLRLTHASGIGADAGAALQALPYGEMLCGRVAATRAPVVVERLQEAADEACAASRALGFRAYAGFPLLAAGGGLLGVLSFASRGRDAFAPEDLGLLATVAHHLAAVRDRLAASRAHAEGEMRLRLATEAAAIGIWDFDPATGGLRWDARCRELFGLPPEAPVSWEGTFLPGLHPGDRDRVEAAALAAMDPGGTGAYDTEYRTVGLADGRLRWVAATGRALFEAGRPVRFAGTVLDVTARKAAEGRQALLAREVDHRARNALAVVSTVVRVTRAEGTADFVAAVEGRVSALARAHRLLADGGWDGAGLRDLAAGELAPFAGGDPDRAALAGPEVLLAPDAVQPMAMVLHELATNAAKHGALSVPGGRVTLAWEPSPGGGLLLEWQERGGPPVDPSPARRGFGTEMLAAAAGQLGGRIAVERDGGGLRCALVIAAAALAGATAPPP